MHVMCQEETFNLVLALIVSVVLRLHLILLININFAAAYSIYECTSYYSAFR